ncbi:hypothetical protein B0T14DRAFT_312179 [Immersiella caudata]|uniref:Secreted protein n=1 Tax=Immersiella caudata TaxID=314043 RepID=A0AA39WFX4_9PEZI|nr:hypothetical protein B0T14DRAFT_312179 [Immersiella caudata]
MARWGFTWPPWGWWLSCSPELSLTDEGKNAIPTKTIIKHSRLKHPRPELQNTRDPMCGKSGTVQVRKNISRCTKYVPKCELISPDRIIPSSVSKTSSRTNPTKFLSIGYPSGFPEN